MNKYATNDIEVRYNPYHDPSNGRFTDANGGGMGGYLYSKGGQSAYVFGRKNDTDFNDDEYEKWRASKSSKNLETYLTGKSPMEAGKIKKALTSEQSLIENAVKSGTDIVDVTSLKPKYRDLNDKLSTHQGRVMFAHKEGYIPQNRVFEASKGRYTNDALKAFEAFATTKDYNVLPSKYVNKEYGISNAQKTGANTYVPISKTAYDYAMYLKKLT